MAYIRKVRRVRTMGTSLRNVAAIAPRKGKYITWAQSPNGRWMLLAGHWSTVAMADHYLHGAGYKVVPFALILPEIERQMGERMGEPTIRPEFTPGA